jgi:hypothetical protein
VLELKKFVILAVLLSVIPLASAYEQTERVDELALTLSRENQAIAGMKTEYTLRITDARGKTVENALVEALAYHQVESGFLLCTIGGKVTTKVIPMGSGTYRVEAVYIGTGEGMLRLDISLDGKSMRAVFRDDILGLPEPTAEVISSGEPAGFGIKPLIIMFILLAAASVMYFIKWR